jgi:hypothetical protein
VLYSVSDTTNFLSRELELYQARQVATEGQFPENVIRSRAQVSHSLWIREMQHADVFQIIKALLIRDHTFLMPFVNQLFELFDNEDVHWTTAKVVGEVNYPDKILTRSHHAAIKVKAVSITFPTVIDFFFSRGHYADSLCSKIRYYYPPSPNRWRGRRKWYYYVLLII